MKKLALLFLLSCLIQIEIAVAQTGPAIQWQNTIGGSDWDELHSIQQTSDSGYILGGLSISNISGDKTENSMGNYDYWIVKTDSLEQLTARKKSLEDIVFLTRNAELTGGKTEFPFAA